MWKTKFLNKNIGGCPFLIYLELFLTCRHMCQKEAFAMEKTPQVGKKHFLREDLWIWPSSSVEQWLLVAVDHDSNSREGEKNFLFHFWVVISWLLFTLELINDYTKWFLIHEKIHHVWLSIRLNNLIAGHKTNWTKNNQGWYWYWFNGHFLYCNSCVDVLNTMGISILDVHNLKTLTI